MGPVAPGGADGARIHDVVETGGEGRRRSTERTRLTAADLTLDGRAGWVWLGSTVQAPAQRSKPRGVGDESETRDPAACISTPPPPLLPLQPTQQPARFLLAGLIVCEWI